MPESIALKTVEDILGQFRPERADSRNDWLTTGMVLHKVLKESAEGLDLWVRWSQQSDKFHDGECERLWETFDADKERTVNLGTLRMWAKGDAGSEAAPLPIPDRRHNADSIKLTPGRVKELSERLRLGLGLPSIAVKPSKPLDELVQESAFHMGGKEAGRWFYQDETSVDVLCVTRFARHNGKKEYRQYSRMGQRWIPRGLDMDCPLYRLLPILKTGDNDTIFVCEGEKAVGALVSIGFLSTTSCGGANSASKTDWRPLAGKRVIILPDNDLAGAQYANKVSHILTSLVPPARISILRLPDLPEKGDAWDFVQNTEGAGEVLAELLKTSVPTAKADIVGGPLLQNMDDVEVREVEWLWKDRIPMGRITLIVGRQGDGKTFMTSGDFASRVSRGLPWPDASICVQGKVLLITAEDSANDTLKPRLLAHAADVTQVTSLSLVRKPQPDGTMVDRSFVLEDVADLEDALQQMQTCRLVVIDPIGSFMGAETDAFRDNEVRAVLSPIARLAETYNCAIVIVAHRRKDGGNNADDLAMGSRAFTALARVVWHVCRDTDNPERRLLLSGKNNLAREGKGLAFTICGTPPKLEWETGPVILTANDSVQREAAANRGQGSEEIDDWLYQELTCGARSVTDMKEEAKSAGLTWGSVMRAALKIKVVKTKSGGDKSWVWSLPEEK